MKNLLKAGIVAFAFSLIFIGAETANAQRGRQNKEARKEYRQDIREARKEYKQDRREARKEYRTSTGRRLNNGYYTSTSRRRLSNGYYTSRSRRAYPQANRFYYRNGRRYVRNNLSLIHI